MIRLLATLFANAAIAVVPALIGAAALVRVYGEGLPGHEELVDYQPPMLSRVYSGEGRVIAEYARQRRVFAPIEEIPPLVKHAFISAEDKNFHTHPGIDVIGIAKAIGRFAVARAQGRNERLAGASTITQQVVKNFQLDSRREIERKIKEMILAVRYDGVLSKDHILELYLNEIYLGSGSYGVAAAAQNYFGKALEELTPPEAAYLAALPKKPSELHPVRDREDALARRDYVLREMEDNGYLTPDEAAAARDAPLDTILDESVPDPVQVAEPDYFASEVRRRLRQQVGPKAVYEGGLTVFATIEPDLQAAAAAALRKRLVEYDRERSPWRGPEAVIEDAGADWRAALAELSVPRDIPGWRPAVILGAEGEAVRAGVEGVEDAVEIDAAATGWVSNVAREGGEERPAGPPADFLRPGDVVLLAKAEGAEGWELAQIPEIQGAFMAMDPRTGRVLALQGGFSYQDSVFNRATQAERQPGSTFKPFVYAAALDAGYSPSTIVLDAPVVVRQSGDTWRPKNSSGGFYGPTPLRLGIIYSRNLMTVRIAQTIGMERVADYAERFGVYEDMPSHLSYALGAGETTLWDMVAAYGMFANGGKRVRPTVIDRIQDRHGDTIFRHDPRYCEGCRAGSYDPADPPVLYDTRGQVMNPVTAHQLVSMMQGVVSQGTASRTVGGLGFPVAGKTGTTNESRDAWFVGFAPNLVAGCYIGFDTPTPMGRGAYGGTLCGPVFRDFMAQAMESRAPGRFHEPDGRDTVVVKIDRDTGERLPDDATGPHVTTQVFRAGTEPALNETGEALMADAALFDGSAETLPYEVNQERRDFDRGDGSGPESASPAPPSPPSDQGLDSGGLY